MQSKQKYMEKNTNEIKGQVMELKKDLAYKVSEGE